MAPGGYTCLAVIFGIMTFVAVCLMFNAFEMSEEKSNDDIAKWALKAIGPWALALFAITLTSIIMRYRQPDVYKDDGKKYVEQKMIDDAVKKYFDRMPVEEKYKILANGRND